MATVAKTQPQPVEKQCQDCGQMFQTPGGFMSNYTTRCPECSDKKTQADYEAGEKAIREKLQRRWEKLCPLEYREIDRAKLPDPKKLDALLRWTFQPRGLLLHGDTGKGKTRCVWQLLKRENFAGRTIAAMDSTSGLHYASIYDEGAKSVKWWIDGLINIDILFMDDIFKNKMTDSFEGQVFTLIDQRIARRRPTIVTSNDTGKTLEARLSVDRAAPLVRRLRESCDLISY